MNLLTDLWTVLFLIGALVSAWNLRECWRDYTAARATPPWNTDGVVDAARYEFGSEAIRFVELLAGFLAGIIAFTQLYPNAILGLLFVLPIGFCLNTIRAARYRVAYGNAHHVRRTNGD